MKESDLICWMMKDVHKYRYGWKDFSFSFCCCCCCYICFLANFILLIYVSNLLWLSLYYYAFHFNFNFISFSFVSRFFVVVVLVIISNFPRIFPSKLLLRKKNQHLYCHHILLPSNERVCVCVMKWIKNHYSFWTTLGVIRCCCCCCCRCRVGPTQPKTSYSNNN